ncbi:MAG: HAMP domain-containing histidine kinase [Alphaproteobacteria bacterium]|nr:HAMP domain-containing histidine kinase [Alphaproteobacteria bacterium]
MRPANVLSGAAFRATLFALAIFFLILILAGSALYQIVRSYQYAELEAQMIEEVVLFRQIFEREGRTGLIKTMKILDKSSPPVQHKLGLFGENNEKLVGSLSVAPDILGFAKMTLELQPGGKSGSFYIHTAKIDKTTIVVGRSLQAITAVIDALLYGLVVTGLIVIATTLLIGYWLSWRVSRKLEALVDTLDRVASGETHVRIPVNKNHNQINRISIRINEHLDRLSILMESTRNTSKAIAHDLRTPLSRVSMLLEEATNDGLKKQKTIELIREAETELVNITGIFDTMLRIARIQSSNDRTGFSPILAKDLVSDVVETYQPVFEVSGQRLILNPQSSTSAKLVCDSKMIKQLLANLLENANRYCPVEVDVNVSVSTTENGGVLIIVADNGPGIPAGELDKVMEPFHRIDTSRTERGAGLGLSLVKAIALRHNAEVTLSDNRPGLRVSITFPPSHLS